jgi:glycosyltransferase involved in cell wall biosynthesis
MACGTPVITSNTSSMIEIMPHKEWLIDPHNIDDIMSKMEKMIDLAREDLALIIEKNFNFSEKFTWEKTASEYLKLYTELAKIKSEIIGILLLVIVIITSPGD